MEKEQVSFTALSTAFCRGYHAAHDTPKIFDDFLANSILTEYELTSIEQYFVNIVQRGNPEIYATFLDRAAVLEWMVKSRLPSPLLLSRARYTEDSLGTAVRNGVKQYVILGAGMDTFAFRRTELLKQLHVFEVDHPATQAFKRNRLTELQWNLPERLHFVPVDFNQENLSEALMNSGYDPHALTLFSWLGVTMYLTRDAVLDTLQSITDFSPAGSSVIFDYIHTDAFIPGKAAPRIKGMMQSVEKLGEPIKSGFDPSTLSSELNSVGLFLKEQLSPTEIQELYFMGRTDGYCAYEQMHFTWAVVK